MKLLTLGVMLAAAIAPPCLLAADGDLTLWYDHPAQSWMTEALPIGNGRLGGMIFGGVETERVQFNEISLWTGDEKDTGAYQDFGDLFINLKYGSESNRFNPTNISGYRRELDITRAVHTASYTYDGVSYRRETFSSHPDQVMVMHFTASQPKGYNGGIRLRDAHQAKTAADGNKIIVSGSLPNGLAYEAEAMILHDGGQVYATNGMLYFDQADSITIILAAGTSYSTNYTAGWRGAHPHEQIENQLKAATDKPYDQLLSDHVRDYDSLFNRVELNLGDSDQKMVRFPTDLRLRAYDDGVPDPELEQLFFQYGRYLLISSSRAGGLPANLQGLWNDNNNPPWRCDYHSNINIEMNYWPAEVTGLPECHQCFLDYINNQREVRKKATQAYYHSLRGWAVQTENNIYGAGSFLWNPPASAWYCQHLWEHYAFTQDTNYLRNFAYPIMKEVCQFWEDRLQELPDHRLVTPDGWSPEHGPHEPGVTYDQEIIWDLFDNYAQANRILKLDLNYGKKIAAMRDRLVQPKIGRWGQLMEWMTDRDDPKDTHRHVSHLFALYPGHQISPGKTHDLATAAKVSLVARGDLSTGWAMAWRINFWARLLDGDHAHHLLRNLLTLVSGTGTDYGGGGGVYANLLDAHPPFQIDGNFGATAGMAEMLVQSQDGDIHLLPALPKAWPNGHVKGLRAHGGFEVEMRWADGHLTEAIITSAIKRPCQVRYAGQSVKLMINGSLHLASNLQKDQEGKPPSE